MTGACTLRRLKGSASNTYIQVHFSIALVYKNSMVILFHSLDINTYTNFQKTLPRLVVAPTHSLFTTTCCNLVTRSSGRNAMRGC